MVAISDRHQCPRRRQRQSAGLPLAVPSPAALTPFRPFLAAPGSQRLPPVDPPPPQWILRPTGSSSSRAAPQRNPLERELQVVAASEAVPARAGAGFTRPREGAEWPPLPPRAAAQPKACAG